MKPADYRRLVAAGMTPDQIALVMEMFDASDEERKAGQRARNRRWVERLGLTRSEWLALAGAVLRRDGCVCAYCGAAATEVDHIVPLIQGGSNDPGNLAAACRPCNGGKSGRTPEQWRDRQ